MTLIRASQSPRWNHLENLIFAAHMQASRSWTEHKNPTKTPMRLFHRGKGALPTPTLLCTYSILLLLHSYLRSPSLWTQIHALSLSLSLSLSHTHTHICTQAHACSLQLAHTICKHIFIHAYHSPVHAQGSSHTHTHTHTLTHTHKNMHTLLYLPSGSCENIWHATLFIAHLNQHLMVTLTGII